MLAKVKTLLGIKDALQDEVINIIIENVEGHLTYLLDKETPSSLSFVVTEISIMRYNRLGSEGMKSELVEGHRVDFYEPKDDFQPYLSIIDKEVEKDPVEPVRGRVLFI